MNTISIHLSSVIRIRRDQVPGFLREIFGRRLTFKNPLFGKKLRFGEPVKHEIPETLEAIWEDGEDLVIAKGYLEEVIRLFHAHRFTPELVDETPALTPLKPYRDGISFEGSGLNADQSQAVKEMERHRFGILEGMPGSGKRLCAIKLAILKQLPMLVIVHTKAEMYQWRDIALQNENGIEESAVGLLGDGKWEKGRPMTISIAPSLWKHFDEIEKETGLLIIDRCNYASWSAIFKTRFFSCACMWGLASGARADGLTKLMETYIGPRLVRLESRRALPGLRVIPTEFESAGGFDEVMRNLVQSEVRNALIAADILQAAAMASHCVLVSDRISHLSAISDQVRDALGPEFVILHAATKADELEKSLSKFNIGKLRILAVPLKSVPLLDPVKRIDCFFVVAPVRQSDYLMQIISKMGEGGMIYEYKDRNPVLRFSLGRRIRMYRRMGIR